MAKASSLFLIDKSTLKLILYQGNQVYIAINNYTNAPKGCAPEHHITQKASPLCPIAALAILITNRHLFTEIHSHI